MSEMPSYQQTALNVLGLDKEPTIPFLDMGGWRSPPDAWVDYQIMEHLVVFEDGARVSELADQVGQRGGRISGRCRALVNRGLLVEVRGHSLRHLDTTVYDLSPKPKGKAYRIRKPVLRKAERS